MKINAYGASPAESTPSLTNGVADATKGSTAGYNTQHVSSEDTTSLTTGVASVLALTDVAFDTSSRAAKIAALEQSVRSGQYTIDPTQIAGALSKAEV